jgi:glutamate/tyrosine decarboxylase-like PLP-dependent enzyme
VLGAAVDHAAAYRDSLDSRPQAPALTYRQMRERVVAPVPEAGADAAAILDELVRLAEPGLMPVPGPRFFGWVMGSSALPGVAADVLVSAWGQNAGYQGTSPAMAAIEETAEAWLLDILDLPRDASIGFTTGATVANGICLAAARTRVLLDSGWDPDADGLFGAPPVEVLIGADAHSSVFSGLQLIGFGYNRVTRLPADAQGRMDAAALAAALARGRGPRRRLGASRRRLRALGARRAGIAAACRRDRGRRFVGDRRPQMAAGSL